MEACKDVRMAFQSVTVKNNKSLLQNYSIDQHQFFFRLFKSSRMK